MQHRRSWTARLDGVERHIDVVYAALSGWMSIDVDGHQQKRGWREWQTVLGGAVLSCELEGHRLEARITQPFGRQQYAFALSIDGVIQPGSDAQPDPANLKRQTLTAFGMLMAAIFLFTFVRTLLERLG